MMIRLHGSSSILTFPLSYATNRRLPRHARMITHASSPADALVDWVQREGGIVNGVSVKQFSGADGGSGFGLISSASHTHGSKLISLPSNLHLTYNNTTTDPKLLALINQVPSSLWGAKLALQLLAHRVEGSSSPFAPYIAALPLGFQGLPMFFKPDEVTALEYPPVTEQVKRRCRWLLSFSTDVLGLLHAPTQNNNNSSSVQQDPFHGVRIDVNALGWALGAVTSRAFRTRGPDHPAALLPLIDMANHSFNPNAKIVQSSTHEDGVDMVAIQDINIGDPILLSYGNLPNDFLLLDYGFIVPNNPYDTVQLRFDRNLIEAAKAVANVGSAISAKATSTCDDDDDDDGNDTSISLSPSAWQATALESVQLSGPHANTEVHICASTATSSGRGDVVDPRLLAGVRILCAANAQELRGIHKQQLSDWNTPISLRNEKATLRTLSGIALIALSQFSTNVEDDVQLVLNGKPLSDNMQLAVRFRLEKKRILANALEVLSQRLKDIETGDKEEKRFPATQAPSPSPSSSKGFGSRKK